MLSLSRKIDFMIVGAQKSGTSALDHYLRKHPAIGLGQKKELHFFDDEKLFEKGVPDYSLYHQKFDESPNNKIYGEVTPIYLYWKPSCQRIWEYNPEIKLIFILRNPIDRAFSHWNMEFGRKVEKMDFSYCIRNEKMRLAEVLPSQHRVYSYIDRGRYSGQIRRFKKLFSSGQLYFIKYEEFKSNQLEELRKLFLLLGVDPEIYNFKYQQVYKLKQHAIIQTEDKDYLLKIFKTEIDQIQKMLDWDCSDWLEV